MINMTRCATVFSNTNAECLPCAFQLLYPGHKLSVASYLKIYHYKHLYSYQ